MTPQPQNTQEEVLSQTEFQAYVREQMRAALRVTLTPTRSTPTGAPDQEWHY